MASPVTLDATAVRGVNLTNFNSLSIIAVVFATLSALFGAYVVLFILAIWSTYRRHGPAYRILRVVTIVLFIDLLVHYICRCITMAQSRLPTWHADEQRMVTVPLVFIGGLTCTFAGFLSDGLLAWRFYVVYGRKKWALYMPVTAVVTNALVGFAGDFQHFSFYHSTWLYTIAFKLDALRINFAWGWFTFMINTVLSGAIIARIILISRNSKKRNVANGYTGSPYNTALAAVIESALITWVGLLMYLVSVLAPTGHVTSAWNVGYVMLCIIPIFFGISQCLITARLGLPDVESETLSMVRGTSIVMASESTDSRRPTGEVIISVSCETVSKTDVEKGAGVHVQTHDRPIRCATV